MAKSRKINIKKAARQVDPLDTPPQTDGVKIEVGEIKISNVDKARDFLARNKVFFETLAATMLTIMAVVLAWGQLLVTQEQTKYLEQQTQFLQQQIEVERAQAYPQFIVDLESIHDPETNAITGDVINIYNQGNLARELHAETLVFIDALSVDETGSHLISIPLDGYFWITTYTGNASGLVLSIQGNDNFSRWLKISNSFDTIIHQKNKSITLHLKRYVRLSYLDIFDTNHIEYYLVSATGSPDVLEKTEAEAIFSKHEYNKIITGVVADLDRLTPYSLYEMVK